MKLVINFAVLLLAGLAVAAPSLPEKDDKIIITKQFYPDIFVIYKSKHDIVNILVPLNYLNDDFSDLEEGDKQLSFFFVEADVSADGKRTDKGLYVFKDNQATKLLDNGRDAATNDETPTQVFFGAQDGIYVYKEDTKEAVKYGSVSDSIIGIAKPTLGDAIYILTEDNEVFNVTEAGNKKTKINEVVDAKQIVLDYSNNLYFYDQHLEPYVLTTEGVKKIKGLPAKPTSVNLLKPPIILVDGVPFVVDNTVYVIYENGTSEATGIEFKPKAKPTAYSPETMLLQYYGYNKKIYEYNLLAILDKVFEGDFKNVLEENSSNIQSLATKTKEKKSNKSKNV